MDIYNDPETMDLNDNFETMGVDDKSDTSDVSDADDDDDDDDDFGMEVVTLGMLIIDEIHFQAPRQPQLDILGGAGSWAVFGARLFHQYPDSKRIGWTVHKGSDFPQKIEDEINTWETTCNFISTPERLTTRGWNSYGDNEERAFKYLTEKLRIDETQLTDSFVLSLCFHLICTPTRCMDLIKGIHSRRQALLSEHPEANLKPVFVWEPVPDSMSPEALEDFYKVLPVIDVVSPNHHELAALLPPPAKNQPQDMKLQCNELLDKAFDGIPLGAIVVRCGADGCYIATSKRTVTVPAFHQNGESVVDPTGAGNAFLGGLCVGVLDNDTLDADDAIVHAALYGTVAASFAVEQVGLPKLTAKVNGKEQWNHANAEERLDMMKEKMGHLLRDTLTISP